jgi:hypothetical protein
MVRGFSEPQSGDRVLVNRVPLIISDRRPFGARLPQVVTQGSQSLALGLTLNTATQFVEGSRLTSSSYD